jgi:hypothetical protein
MDIDLVFKPYDYDSKHEVLLEKFKIFLKIVLKVLSNQTK